MSGNFSSLKLADGSKKKEVKINKENILRLSKCIGFPLLLLVFVSCGNRPGYVLSEDKMVDLMVDMELAEAYANNSGGTKTNEAKKELGRRILASHNVTPEQLDTTLAWYGKNIDDYSELFDKVDKEILRRKEKYIIKEEVVKNNIDDNLWPYSDHLVISPLSGDESMILSIEEPQIERGERVKLSFFLPNPIGLKGVWGVEYGDGTAEAAISTFNGKSKIEIELQTDTAKNISRLYGVMTIREKIKNPVYIDSIFVSKIALDSMEYRQKKRNQKKYGVILPNPEKILKPDSLSSDSIATDTILTDTVPSKEKVSKLPSNIRTNKHS